MGCDIHLYCERKYNDKWICADHFMVNPYYYEYDDEPEYEVKHIYHERNYAVFGVLADVRNYGNNECICEPKGIPNDISKEVKKEYEEWESDAHSASWFTAKELFRWQKLHPTTSYRGMISQEQIKALEEYGEYPKSWCQWTNQSGHEMREWTVPGSCLDSLIDKIKERMADIFRIYSWLNDKEREEAFQKYSEDFRIVFWFDN